MNRNGILVFLALLSTALAVVLGCGGGSSKSTNPGGGASGPSFDLHFPASGTSQRFDFADAGTWDYHCTPHGNQGMTGTVVVSAGAPVDSAFVQVGPGNALTFSPSSVSIRPGGHVRWQNVSSMTNHTVTRP